MAHTKAETIKRFKKAFLRKFGSGAEYSYRAADPEEGDDEHIDVSVPIDSMEEWEKVEPGVEALLKSSGASRYFAIGGAGTGFGFRDISIYRKKRK